VGAQPVLLVLLVLPVPLGLEGPVLAGCSAIVALDRRFAAGELERVVPLPNKQLLEPENKCNRTNTIFLVIDDFPLS
jgi:hypothetical protein